MRLVKANYEIYAASFDKKLPYSYDNNNLLIEIAGRTCYKSEGTIAEGTAEKFVNMLRSRGHCAMIEHSWELRYYDKFVSYYKFLNFMPFENGTLVAGNIRAFEEWGYDFKSIYLTPTNDMINEIYHQKRWDMLSATVKVVTDRGVTHEQVRHRPPAYAQESTRWCNYCQSRFNNHVTFLIPCWLHDHIEEGEYTWGVNKSLTKDPGAWRWFRTMSYIEKEYFALSNECGWIPGRARSVLPNSLKTEIVITADLAEWQHIFKLRTAPDAHEQMREVMIPLQEDFKKLMPEVFDS